MASPSAASSERSSVPSYTMTSSQHQKTSSRMKRCVSRSLQANVTLHDTLATTSIGGQIDRLFETPIITTIIAAYCQLSKEGSTESGDLHKVLVYSEKAAIRLRYNEAKTQLSSLKSLTLEEIRNYQSYLRIEKSSDIIKLCTGLKHLDLSDSDIDDTELRDLAPFCPHLLSLNLAGCNKITDDGIKPFASCSSLTSLQLGGCNQLTDAIHVLAIPTLRVLNLAGCSRLTNDGIIPFAKLKQLAHVNLSFCPQLTDTGIIAFSTCYSLISLNLASCTKLTYDGIKSLAACKELTFLNLEYCHHFTTGRRDLALARPSLKVFI